MTVKQQTDNIARIMEFEGLEITASTRKNIEAILSGKADADELIAQIVNQEGQTKADEAAFGMWADRDPHDFLRKSRF